MNMKTMLYAVILVAAGWAGDASAQSQRTARGPICDSAARVGSTTLYSCTGSSHNALDMSNKTCNTWFARGMLLGTFSYTYYGGCGQSCGSCSSGCCNGGAGNYVRVVGAGGWDFRQLHFNHHSTESKSKACDRCPFGLVGSTGSSTAAHVHADNRRDGVRQTAWYTNVGTTCGSSAYCENRVGVPTL
jgi:hypothetical protein